jgi:endoglucanase
MVTDIGTKLRPRPRARRRHARRGASAWFLGRRRQWSPSRRFAAWAVVFLVLGAIVSVLVMLTTNVSGVDQRGTGRPPPAGGRGGSNSDPFSGTQLYVDPSTPAARAEASLERSNPAAAALLRMIASHPAGIWFGSWIPIIQVAAAVGTVMREAEAHHSMPLLVLYAFPYRGCGGDATGGSAEAAAYQRWIGQVVVGIGAGKAAVILEPDALAEYVRLACLSPAEQQYRLMMIRGAVDQLVRLPNTAVYLDAGNSRWQSAKVMASLLLAAGIGEAHGFSLNVSNFDSTVEEESYGDSVSAILHGKHYVIDTSRNGAATAKTWCNPPGQALGVPPTASTGSPLVDALLWIKPPWASDGTCNGGPPAGMFWLSYALSLARNARW